MKSNLQNISLFVTLFLLSYCLVGAQPSSAAARAARDKYHYAWELVAENYFWDNRLNKWPSWEHKHDSQIHDDSDANEYIRKMYKSLKDRWTHFMGVKQTTSDTERTDAKNIVSSKVLPNNIGYIKINTFSSKRTGSETDAAMRGLSQVDAYVLDLRSNRGGNVQESLEVFAIFMEEGLYSHLEGRRKGKKHVIDYVLTPNELQVTRGGKLQHFYRCPNHSGGKPLVVLVNGDTASCSESLAGALRDHGRAVLFGSRTFGKAVATHTYQLQGYVSVQIVFARSTLPKGSCIHDVGIIPDHEVKSSGKGDNVLTEACKFLEKKLKPQGKTPQKLKPVR